MWYEQNFSSNKWLLLFIHLVVNLTKIPTDLPALFYVLTLKQSLTRDSYLLTLIANFCLQLNRCHVLILAQGNISFRGVNEKNICVYNVCTFYVCMCGVCVWNTCVTILITIYVVSLASVRCMYSICVHTFVEKIHCFK